MTKKKVDFLDSLRLWRMPEMKSDPLFAPLVDYSELESLLNQYPMARLYHFSMPVTGEFFETLRFNIFENHNRRGEIALSIRNEYQKLLVHTKPYYPHNIYRIPTGGIEYDESILDGMKRELAEETGFVVEKFFLAAIIFYEFHLSIERFPFITYLFQMSVENQQPVSQDPDENISDFQWADREQLDEVVAKLQNMGSSWKSWGLYRSLPHLLV